MGQRSEAAIGARKRFGKVKTFAPSLNDLYIEVRNIFRVKGSERNYLQLWLKLLEGSPN